MAKRYPVNGKPHAENPHVRFDAGKVAQACTAETSLRRMSLRRQPETRNGRGIAASLAVLLLCFMCHAEDAESASVSATATEKISVDSRSGFRRAVAPCKLWYDTAWCEADSSQAHVVIEKVEHAGMFNATTQDVVTLSVDAYGSHTYELGEEDERCVRFIHRVYSADGVEIGEPLVSDVAFGYVSAPGASFGVDSRSDSLQKVSDAKLPIKLAYSTDWTKNAASLTIKAVRLSGNGGAPVSTNTVFTTESDAEGTAPLQGISAGWWRLLCQLFDGSGGVLLEYTTDDFRRKGGLALSLR